MCRLLGMIGTPPLSVVEALNAFYPLCTEGIVPCTEKPGHFDGWGISGFSQGRAVYFARRAESASEDRPAFDSAVAKAKRTQSPVVVAHLRKASSNVRQINNTHPFHWRDWVFAHNGTVFNPNELKLGEAVPQGKTDSERLGLWFIERMLPSLKPTETLVELLKDMRAKLIFSSLTFLMSDGETLWAYRDVGDKNLEKEETPAERERYFTLWTAPKESAILICSEPLVDIAPNWKPIDQRTLLVLAPQKAPQHIKI